MSIHFEDECLDPTCKSEFTNVVRSSSYFFFHILEKGRKCRTRLKAIQVNRCAADRRARPAAWK